MADLRRKIDKALIIADEQKDKRSLCTLRLVKAAIKDRDNAEKALGHEPVEDAVILEIISDMVMQRMEATKLYQESNRIELAKQEAQEIEILQSFLPEQLDNNEMREACKIAIIQSDANGLRDMGKCISFLKEQYPGKMNYCKASTIVKELLQ